MKVQNQIFLFFCLTLFGMGCSFSGVEENPLNPLNPLIPNGPNGPSSPFGLDSYLITEEDYDHSKETQGNYKVDVFTLHESKQEKLQRAFIALNVASMAGIAPHMSRISLDGHLTNNFSVMKFSNFKPYGDLDVAYLLPRIYVLGKSDPGSVFVYDSGQRKRNGKKILNLSIAFAIVDGLTNALAKSLDTVNSSISVPEHFQIPDPEALKEKLGVKELRTLTLCPGDYIHLQYKGAKFSTKTPFQGNPYCEPNQIYRISFKISEEHLVEILESSAVLKQAVEVDFNPNVYFGLSSKYFKVKLDGESFFNELKEQLKVFKKIKKDGDEDHFYDERAIDISIENAVYETAKKGGLKNEGIANRPNLLSFVKESYFSEYEKCDDAIDCRNFHSWTTSFKPIEYQWSEVSELSAQKTPGVSYLGAVANSVQITAKPHMDMMVHAQRPQVLRDLDKDSLLDQCKQLAGNDKTSSEEDEEVKVFCNHLLDVEASQERGEFGADGYYPLGGNISVYPGAWVRLEISKMAELTTAKFENNPDGTHPLQSVVLDQLKDKPRIVCAEGQREGCLKYEETDFYVRDSQGNSILDAEGNPTVKKVLKYKCKNEEDKQKYCPYSREIEMITGFEYKQHCEKVEYKDSGFLWGLFGSSSGSRLECRNSEAIPTRQKMTVPVCTGFEPKNKFITVENLPMDLSFFPGFIKRTPLQKRVELEISIPATVAPEESCKDPTYICKQWNVNCSRYSVNESFTILHENPDAKWREFAIHKGEYPTYFQSSIYLKFVSPSREVTNCRLDQFEQGSTSIDPRVIFFKIPTPEEEKRQKNQRLVCHDEKGNKVPIWDEENVKKGFWPHIYIKNSILHQEERLCGRTEYSYFVEEIKTKENEVHHSIIPPAYRSQLKPKMGGIPESCRSKSYYKKTHTGDLYFIDRTPVQFEGTLSVLGKMLESILY